MTSENTEGKIRNGQSRETGNIGYTVRKKTPKKPQHNMCWTPLYVNKHKQRKIRHEPSYKQLDLLEVLTNRTLLLIPPSDLKLIRKFGKS